MVMKMIPARLSLPSEQRPSNDNNNQSVLYAPPYPSFIDIKNDKPIYLRNIKARILQADRARIDTEGLCSLVLLVESGASQFHP